MKKFRDLKIGDAVYVGFKKKTVTRVKLYDDDPDNMMVYISKDEYYFVKSHSSVDYCWDLHDPAEWIFTEKDAITEYLTQGLRDLKLSYEDNKALYEKWLERTKELE